MEMQNGAATLKNNLAAQDVKRSYHLTKQFHSYVYTPQNWKQVHKKQNWTAVSQITLFHSVSSHHWYEKNRFQPQPLRVVCLVPHVVCGLPLGSLVGWMCIGWVSGLTCPRLSVCTTYNGRAACAGLLPPWAAGTGSGHPIPWTGISVLENNYLTCFY